MPPSIDPDAPEPTEELLNRAQHGGRAAFDALIRRSQPQLARLVHARLGRKLRQLEDSADLVQSALAEAVRDLPRFEYRGNGSFLRWLSAIVAHKLRHHARDAARARRDPARVEPLPEDASSSATKTARAAGPSPLDVAVGHELEARYLGAIARLPEAERELVMLRLELHCDYAAIAAALSLSSADAVRKRLVRALARLETLMSESRT